MSKSLAMAATGLANRTSRRGFLGRAGQLLLGVVGGSALMALMAGTAKAETDGILGCPDCPNPCLHWGTCTCSSNTRMRNHYDCPACQPKPACNFTTCTNFAC